MSTKFQSLAQPIDVATDDTLSFIERHCKLSGLRVLEVGCGRGHLACALVQRGASLLAIDSNEEAVSETAKKGVEARVLDFLQFADCPERFDALVIARCFHHLQPLGSAAEAVRTLLKPGGTLILEEFAAERMDERTIAWLNGWSSIIDSKADGCDKHNHNHSYALKSLDGWKTHHFVKHEVSTFADMMDQLNRCLQIEEISSTPYLYRYLIDCLPNTHDGAERLAQALAEERLAIDQGLIEPIGARVVASKARA